VYDSEVRYVGAIEGAYALDPFRRPLALLVPSADMGASLIGPDGRELGTVQQENSGSCLLFGAALPNNPFARMLLLAMVLVK
jgi:hypothetical protein